MTDIGLDGTEDKELPDSLIDDTLLGLRPRKRRSKM